MDKRVVKIANCHKEVKVKQYSPDEGACFASHSAENMVQMCISRMCAFLFRLLSRVKEKRKKEHDSHPTPSNISDARGFTCFAERTNERPHCSRLEPYIGVKRSNVSRLTQVLLKIDGDVWAKVR